MSTLTLNHIRKVYPNGAVGVDDFDLTVKDREFLVLVGPSGCGKSTTLRMVAGLETITSGTIEIDGKVINHLPPKERDIAMVFQNYALYPHMTVHENMAFGLKLRKTPKAEIAKRIAEAAETLGLSALLDRLPRQLSGGQRQRVALGRAIVRKPKVFLFDEPLSNLDAKMRVEMREEIHRLHHLLQATILYVTHDQTEAMTLGDRIVVMEKGLIRQAADPITLYNRPANTFVAGFIGTPPMNFLPVTLSPDGKTLSSPAGILPLSTPNSQRSTLLLGFRPENIRVDTTGEGLTATADIIEQMGSEVYIHFNVAGEHIIARLPPDTPISRGDIRVLVPTKVTLFDPATGNAIG